ncbi:IDEAL domain-containing protein [Aneurinibacillus soli]|uniref:Uncharacterized protein n=1 Tax=Aneurinibacillus soli TaxID=1500254 RepID=A0A0U4WK30_9BACL|nr:IDEAL domain-containing protein [Aneurinibacillus soli]PYE63066.1 IDEAL domain-containing protein [Aneurinibacillus soli]BAU28875.1 hypothetical protein CB4_03052 [Aneurinibacillus soli]
MEKQKPSILNPSMLSLLAEMVLDEAIYKYRTESLYKRIDEALENKDEANFNRLTTELKQIQASRPDL